MPEPRNKEDFPLKKSIKRDWFISIEAITRSANKTVRLYLQRTHSSWRRSRNNFDEGLIFILTYFYLLQHNNRKNCVTPFFHCCLMIGRGLHMQITYECSNNNTFKEKYRDSLMYGEKTDKYTHVWPYLYSIPHAHTLHEMHGFLSTPPLSPSPDILFSFCLSVSPFLSLSLSLTLSTPLHPFPICIEASASGFMLPH